MSKEKQILQLYAEKHSQRSIASILGVSRNTVASVIAGLKRTGKTVQDREKRILPVLCRITHAGTSTDPNISDCLNFSVKWSLHVFRVSTMK